MNYSKIVTKVKPSVAKVIVLAGGKDSQRIGTGTGFVFGKSNILVTCNHIVKDPDGIIYIKFPDDKQFIEAKIAIRDEEHDLALLKFNSIKRKPLKLALENINEGMEVVFSGYPLGLDNLTTHQGILSSVSEDAIGITTYLIDGTVNRGNSGCPLMSVKGEVIGVVNAYKRESKHILDKVEEMKAGAISLHNIDIVNIYKALIDNLQLGIGSAIPAGYIPKHKEIAKKTLKKKKVGNFKPKKKVTNK